MPKKIDSDKLTVREEKFVRALATTNSVKDAVIAAGSKAKNEQVAANIGTQMLARPRVQNAVQAMLERQFPNAEEEFGKIMKRVTDLALESPKLTEVVAAMRELSKVLGYQSPKQIETKSLKATIKLPGSE